MAEHIKNNNPKSLVCPFCSIHCDDIVINTNNEKFSLPNTSNVNCSKRIESFNINKKSLLVPRIKNIETTISSALNKTKKEIIKNNEILVLNHGTDMSGIRSILNFASHHNAIIDHVNSKFLHQNIGVVQRTGYMATSLMEVKNRADLIVIFGNDILDKTPRLLDKIFLSSNSLWTKNSKKEIILVGEFSSRTVAKIKKKCSVINIKIKLDLIPEFLKTIDSCKMNKDLKISNNIIIKVNKIVKKAKYMVATWSASDFIKTSNAEIIISSIAKFIVEINNYRRAACLPISGNLGDATSSQVLTWTTGFPSCLKYLNGSFSHDKNSFNGLELIKNKNIELVIHINSLSMNKLELDSKLTNIVIGHPNSKFSSIPDIFIPIGIPGIDHKGIMFRTDNVVSVHLKKIRDIKLPTLKYIFDGLI